MCFGKVKSVASNVGHVISLPVSYTTGYSVYLTQGRANAQVPRVTNCTLTSFNYNIDEWTTINTTTDKHWGAIGY